MPIVERPDRRSTSLQATRSESLLANDRVPARLLGFRGAGRARSLIATIDFIGHSRYLRNAQMLVAHLLEGAAERDESFVAERPSDQLQADR